MMPTKRLCPCSGPASVRLGYPAGRMHGGVLARYSTPAASPIQSACDYPRLIDKSRQAGECTPSPAVEIEDAPWVPEEVGTHPQSIGARRTSGLGQSFT